MRKTLFYLLGLGLWCGCRPQEQQLEAGPWRGVLQRSDGIEIPFQFEVRDTAGHQVIDIVNGAGRLRVDSLRFSGDSVYIHMPFFDSDFQLARSVDHPNPAPRPDVPMVQDRQSLCHTGGGWP